MKKRMIDPEIFSDDALGMCGPIASLLFLGLQCSCDCEGKQLFKPLKIKAQIFPYYDVDINAEIQKLINIGYVKVYEANSIAILKIVNFSKLQQVYHKERSLELPDEGDSLSLSEASSKLTLSLAKATPNTNNNIINTNTLKEGECEGEPINTPALKPKPKPDLEKLGSHFKATKEQIQDLISQDGDLEFKTRVQTINDYCAATGKAYKDYPAAYRNFRKRDKEKISTKSNAPPRNESRYERSQRNSRELHEKIMREQNQDISTLETSVFLLED